MQEQAEATQQPMKEEPLAMKEEPLAMKEAQVEQKIVEEIKTSPEVETKPEEDLGAFGKT